MSEIVKIKSIEKLNHNVIRLRFEKPASFQYKVSQSVDVSINKKDWETELRAFTFTSLPEENDIELVIKVYPEHNSVTQELSHAKVGDELILQKPFGNIPYKGPGIFIAGGSGVTPFICMFKHLKKENQLGHNKLIFANKTKEDIILKSWFEELFGKQFINVLSGEQVAEYEHGYITAEILKKHLDPNKPQYFYLCGPGPMMKATETHLRSLGVKGSSIVLEEF